MVADKIKVELFEAYLSKHCVREQATSIPYFDIWGESTPIDFLFRMASGEPFISRGDLQTIKGREKMGKSAAGIILVASALGGEFAGVEATHNLTKVLWIDTEQSDTTLRARVQETLRMASAKDEALRVVALRGYEPSERLKIAIEAIADTQPDFVFLDGVVDLCVNFNDNEECSKVVGQLLKATKDYNCAIVGVIHTNKKDTEARGHLGTILQQKSAEIYEVTKAEGSDTATIKQSLSRFAPVPCLRFRFGDGFTLETVESTRAKENERFCHLLAGRKALRYNELVKAYMDKYETSESTAKRAIKDATDNTLYKDEQGLYTYLFPLYGDDTDDDNI